MKGNQANGLFYANSNITKTIRRWLYPIITIAAHIISSVWQYISINLTHWTLNAMCAVYVRCGLRVNRCALWQPPRYAGSWPSCPSCSSRRQAWDSRWPGTQTMPRRLTRRSGRWESWWILGELGEGGERKERGNGLKKKDESANTKIDTLPPGGHQKPTRPAATTPRWPRLISLSVTGRADSDGSAYFLGII